VTVDPHAGKQTGVGQQVVALQTVPGGQSTWPLGHVASELQQLVKLTQ
jgi:hypothetical protein